MNGHDEAMLDAVAAFAIGASPAAETGIARAHLAACEICREAYHEFVSAAGVVALAAEAEGAPLSSERASALKSRVLAAAVAQRAPRAVATSGYARAVPREELVPYAPGIEWAVVPAAGMTLVYWVFEPPACGKLPPEFHAQSQAGMVLEGVMNLHYGDGSRHVVRTGDVYAISPGTVHGASFEERTVLFETYVPNYAEFEVRYRAMRGR